MKIGKNRTTITVTTTATTTSTTATTAAPYCEQNLDGGCEV